MSKPTPDPIGKLDSAIREEIIRIADKWLSDTDPSRNTALIMIAALFVGPSEAAVAEITGCPAALVSVIAARLRASGLWVDGGTDYSDWSAAKPLGVINFGLNLDVAEGVFTRTAAKENGQYGYTLVAEGLDAALEEEWDEAGFPDPESSID